MGGNSTKPGPAPLVTDTGAKWNPDPISDWREIAATPLCFWVEVGPDSGCASPDPGDPPPLPPPVI